MIQVLPAVNRGPSKGEKINRAIEQGLSGALELYAAHDKKKRYAQAIQGAEGIYNDPNLDEQQKFIKAFGQFQDFPEVQERLAGPLSRLGEQRSKQLSKTREDEAKREQLGRSFQNIQDLYSNPDLTEEQRTFGVYQELSNNSSLAHNLLGSLNQQKKGRSEDESGQLFSKGYDAILKGDNEGLGKVLDDPKTPLAIKKQLTDLKNQEATRRDVQNRELRARQTLIQKSYTQAIKNEQAKLNYYAKPDEAVKIKKNIKKLEALQRHDLKRIAKDPNSYSKLSLWDAIDPDFLPEEIEDEEDFEGINEPMEAQSEKIMFDPRNPEHAARARQVLQQVGGDRQRANAILAEEFNL